MDEAKEAQMQTALIQQFPVKEKQSRLDSLLQLIEGRADLVGKEKLQLGTLTAKGAKLLDKAIEEHMNKINMNRNDFIFTIQRICKSYALATSLFPPFSEDSLGQYPWLRSLEHQDMLPTFLALARQEDACAWLHVNILLSFSIAFRSMWSKDVVPTVKFSKRKVTLNLNHFQYIGGPDHPLTPMATKPYTSDEEPSSSN